jgi:tRNA pseudouridine13 synthase
MQMIPPPSDWQQLAASWPLAYGNTVGAVRLKQAPEDFRVCEQISLEPSGSGEHVLLRVRKRKANTAQVAKELARFAQVAYKDVSFSGLKDYFAVTEQWFSVWIPGKPDLQWANFNADNIEILEATRHHRKLRRGTHSGNRFDITLRNFSGDEQALRQRWTKCCDQGVPNYYGPQRFGRDYGNLQTATEMFLGKKRVKDRALRGLLLSAARSWLFNECLAARVEAQDWSLLHDSEPAILDGSESFFVAQKNTETAARLARFDIHPSCPLWGDLEADVVSQYAQLHATEKNIVERYPVLVQGLQAARMAYSRRASRMLPKNPQLNIQGDEVRLSFDLRKGQFATAVLRELVVEATAAY